MKTPDIKFPLNFIIVVILMIVSLLLTACGTGATPMRESSPETAEDSQTEIFIPAIESASKENVEKGMEDQAYPGADQEIQADDISESSESEALPEIRDRNSNPGT